MKPQICSLKSQPFMHPFKNIQGSSGTFWVVKVQVCQLKTIGQLHDLFMPQFPLCRQGWDGQILSQRRL